MAIVTQSEAARIASTSRQNINRLQEFPDLHSFFTPDGQVDTDNPSWERYLASKRAKERRKKGLLNDEGKIIRIDRFSLFVDAAATVLTIDDEQLAEITAVYNEMLDNLTRE